MAAPGWGSGWGSAPGWEHGWPTSYQQDWQEPPSTVTEVGSVVIIGVLLFGVAIFLKLGCSASDHGHLSKEGRPVAFDLIEGRVHFSDVWLADYSFHAMNYHPLLGIFMCHPDNPYRKWRRVVVLLSTTFVSTISCTLVKAMMPKWQVVARFVVTTLFINFPILLINQFLVWCSVFPARWELFQSTGHFRQQFKCFGPCLSQLARVAFYVVALGTLFQMMRQVFFNVQDASENQVNGFVEALPSAFGNVLVSWVLWFAIDICIPVRGFGHPCFPDTLKPWYRWTHEEMRPLGTPDPEADAMLSNSSTDSDDEKGCWQ